MIKYEWGKAMIEIIIILSVIIFMLVAMLAEHIKKYYIETELYLTFIKDDLHECLMNWTEFSDRYGFTIKEAYLTRKVKIGKKQIKIDELYKKPENYVVSFYVYDEKKLLFYVETLRDEKEKLYYSLYYVLDGGLYHGVEFRYVDFSRLSSIVSSIRRKKVTEVEDLIRAYNNFYSIYDEREIKNEKTI